MSTKTATTPRYVVWGDGAEAWYDVCGRLVRAKWIDGTEVRVTYDAEGRLVHAKCSDGTEALFEYDSEDNLVRVEQGGATVFGQ